MGVEAAGPRELFLFSPGRAGGCFSGNLRSCHGTAQNRVYHLGSYPLEGFCLFCFIYLSVSRVCCVPSAVLESCIAVGLA